MDKKIILTGIQPSGRSHIGSYLGYFKNAVKLQDAYVCNFLIADYHSITADYDPKIKKQQIFNLAVDMLAIGLDPKRSNIIIQSDIPQHFELAWILSSVTPVNQLQRMTQFKDKSQNQPQNVNLGLFSYPVLQAADIFIYKGQAVPIGKDQEQHLELTRIIAKAFNAKFGKTFDEPQAILAEIPKVMSLLNPDKKMSKSLGDKHCIYMDESKDEIANKLKSAVTDTGDGHSTGANNLLMLLKAFNGEDEYKKFLKARQSGNLKYSELKEILSEKISGYFEGFRQRKKELLSDPDYVLKVLENSTQKARILAQKTLTEVRKKIGIYYR